MPRNFKQIVENFNQQTELAEDAGEFNMGGGLDGGPGNARNALTDFGTFRVEYPRSVRAANAFLGSFSGQTFIEPELTMNVVKTKLNILGLDFEYNGRLSDGVNMFPLVQWGSPTLGVFGTDQFGRRDLSKEGFMKSDGISERTGFKMALRVVVTEFKGLSRLDLEIVRADVPAPDAAPTAVTDSPEGTGI